MGDLVEVTVQVPGERLGEFHVMYGEWLQQGPNGAGEAPKAVPWSGNDKELAKGMQARLPSKAWQLVSILSKEGEIDEPTLTERLGLTNSPQFNGVNGWVGRVAFAFGRETPTKWKIGPDGVRIWYIDPDVAALFKGIKS